jgi:hypothetical protein
MDKHSHPKHPGLVRLWSVLLAAGMRARAADLPDDMPYDNLLFAGTHNSAINLGPHTLLRPPSAITGQFPSEAHAAFQYAVMNQRLSVRDQLTQGVRVLESNSQL